MVRTLCPDPAQDRGELRLGDTVALDRQISGLIPEMAQHGMIGWQHGGRERQVPRGGQLAGRDAQQRRDPDPLAEPDRRRIDVGALNHGSCHPVTVVGSPATPARRGPRRSDREPPVAA